MLLSLYLICMQIYLHCVHLELCFFLENVLCESLGRNDRGLVQPVKSSML